MLVIYKWKLQVFDDFLYLLDGDILAHAGQASGKIRYGKHLYILMIKVLK